MSDGDDGRPIGSLSTHVLDTATGRPAAGVHVVVEAVTDDGTWRHVVRATTDADGRVPDLVPPGTLQPGVHRVVFATGEYFGGRGVATFWPRVTVEFEVTRPDEHHHVPLLVSPHGYTTYRGS